MTTPVMMAWSRLIERVGGKKPKKNPKKTQKKKKTPPRSTKPGRCSRISISQTQSESGPGRLAPGLSSGQAGASSRDCCGSGTLPASRPCLMGIRRILVYSAYSCSNKLVAASGLSASPRHAHRTHRKKRQCNASYLLQARHCACTKYRHSLTFINALQTFLTAACDVCLHCRSPHRPVVLPGYSIVCRLEGRARAW